MTLAAMSRVIFCFFVLYITIVYNSLSIVETSDIRFENANENEVHETPNILPTKGRIKDTSLGNGHILIFHNQGTRSHLIAINSLVDGLLERGHRVTSVVYGKSSITHKNYSEILIEDR